MGLWGKHHPPKQQHNNHLINVCVCVGGGGGRGGSALPVNVLVEKKRFSRSVNYQNLVYFSHALFSLCESSLDLSFPRPDEEVMVSTQSTGATLRTEAQQRQDKSSMTYHEETIQ